MVRLSERFLQASRAGGFSMAHLSGKRVAILVTEGFEQVEMTRPGEAPDQAGATTTLIAPKGGDVLAFKHHEKADKFKVDLELAKSNATQFDALLLPGGGINADPLRTEKKAQMCVQQIDRDDNPI